MSNNVGFDFSLPPKDAIEFFQNKGFKIGFNWTDVWQEAHARSFTVAGIMKMDVLQDIHDSLHENMETGGTFQSWKNSIVPYLTQRGWYGDAQVIDTETGEIGKQIMPHRLETIYRTNVQSSMMAGRWKALVENAEYRPYLEYVAVMDNRTRPAHAEMNGIILPIDDPFWQNFYPPNGWRCRCTVRSRSERDIERRGLKVYDSKEDDFVEFEQYVNKEETRPAVAYKNPRTGKLFKTDAGFGYNAGKSTYIPNLDKYHAPIAQNFIKESLSGPDFTFAYKKYEKAVLDGLAKGLTSMEIRKQAGRGFKWPVARLNDADASLISEETKTVLLSDDTLIKQIAHRQGQGFTPETYLLVNKTIEDAVVIGKETAQAFLFFKEHDRYYQATVKLTADKKELYLVSFYKINDKDLFKKMSKLEIIKNELD